MQGGKGELDGAKDAKGRASACEQTHVGQSENVLSPARTSSSPKMSNEAKGMAFCCNISTIWRLNPQRGAAGLPERGNAKDKRQSELIAWKRGGGEKAFNKGQQREGREAGTAPFMKSITGDDLVSFVSLNIEEWEERGEG